MGFAHEGGEIGVGPSDHAPFEATERAVGQSRKVARTFYARRKTRLYLGNYLVHGFQDCAAYESDDSFGANG